jgi:hypothetical protein
MRLQLSVEIFFTIGRIVKVLHATAIIYKVRLKLNDDQIGTDFLK